MATRDTNTRRVKTSDTAFEILEAIQKRKEATLSELACDLGFAKSTIHTHISTLEDKGYLMKDGNAYSLGLRFLEHGMTAKSQYDIGRVGQPIIDELADKTGEVSWISVEEHGQAVFLCKSMGEKAIQTHAMVGGRTHLNHLASGKQILAHLSDERREQIIEEHGLPEFTSNTITCPDELCDQLSKIREEKIAINDRETLEGLRAVAVPVLINSHIIGAVSVSGPAHRLTIERCREEIHPLLLGAANEIELKLQYPES